jgi:hypothetical protein
MRVKLEWVKMLDGVQGMQDSPLVDAGYASRIMSHAYSG